MKKIIYAVLVLIGLAFSLCNVSAISTSIKDSYLPGETVITEISGDVINPVTMSNIELKRSGHIGVALDFDIERLGENYYLWFLAPENVSNYTLVINDITTFVSGRAQEIDYKKNFSVLGNLTDYSIRPGFISTNESFQIKVQLNEDFNKQIDLEFLKKTNATLKPGENTLEFSISDINQSGLFNLTIGKYNVPVYIYGKKIFVNIGDNETEIIDLTNLSTTRNLTTNQQQALDKERSKYRCVEQHGILCSADQTCSGEIIASMDGPCCVGVDAVCLVKESEEGGSGAWIGYLIAAIVIITGIFIWIRYKRIKAEKNPLKKVLSLERKTP